VIIYFKSKELTLTLFKLFNSQNVKVLRSELLKIFLKEAQ